ncbi:MAG: hypothetical protein BWK73_04530 [Thiothrix lacustris]|uniref:Uncharacterized protein n=1 Tax=Thiothrix lacustris TaxID=525917 RepID=A0A1Y1QXE5_9GAMM|nr:MAG: hypothetical protein BWK73_04530 [Thiothrix lacustris]
MSEFEGQTNTDALQKLTDEAAAELEAQYAEARNDIAQQIILLSAGGYFASKYLGRFLKYITHRLTALTKNRNALIEHTITLSIRLGIQPAIAAGADIMAVAQKDLYEEIFNKKLADGFNLSERLWRIDNGANRALTQAVKQAVAKGVNPMQAARAFLERGEGIPKDILEKLEALRTSTLQQAITDHLLTGKGNALYNVQRVFQTETTRAHALAYVESNAGVRGLIGYRFRLSPMHRKVDICDTLAAADRYGLGRGVYPVGQIMGVYPAHPNTRSSIVAVFRD